MQTLIPLTETDVCCPAPAAPAQLSDVQGTVQVLGALADPTRLQIVALLAGQDGPLCVCHITERFALGQPTISHHLRVLREAGLVAGERRGLWVYYTLNPAALGAVTGYLDNLLARSAPAQAAA